MKPSVKWNPDLKMIVSDVDETIADLYLPATKPMLKELEKVLDEGKILFLISGQSVKSLQWRITDHVKPELRKHILIGHCSGVEVWGFDNDGKLRDEPFYSLYESSLTEKQRTKWRAIIKQLLKEFKLKIHPTMPVKKFKQKTGDDPRAIMFEDRGPQITFEVVNGYDLPDGDLRLPIVERAHELLEKADIPITARLAGEFAIDFAVKGVSKTTAVQYVVEHDSVLLPMGLTKEDLKKPKYIEIWGDKFSIARGGTDRHISEALDKQVRSISFRKEDPREFLEGYNIVVWDGERNLHEGLLEFLQSR